MGVLGKDLFYTTDNIFEFTALFSLDTFEVEERTYKLGEVTTEFLNYDASRYIELTEDLDQDKFYEHFEEINRLVLAMPFIGQLSNLKAYPGHAQVKMLMGENPRNFLLDKMQHFTNLCEDLKLIQKQYKNFLSEIFYREFNGIKNDKYAYAIENNGMSAFVSGRSLGKVSDVDPADISMQFEVKVSGTTSIPKLYEKIVFRRLSDFIYVEFFKGIMQDNIPKMCKNCGTYFLQEKGFNYEYCGNIAPNETDKTCRSIGSKVSFKNKVQNNEIWKVHQRAYKKYFARIKSKTMTNEQFLEWSKSAEELREKALAKSKGRLAPPIEKIADEFKKEINKY